MACFRRCCCCVNLRVGGIMMGIMTLALSVFSIIPMAISLANRVFLARVITHLVDEYSAQSSDGQKSGFDSMDFWGVVSNAVKGQSDEMLPPEDKKEVQWLASVMLVFFIVALVLLLVYAVCSICLIYGAVKGTPRWLLLPWIVATFAFALVFLAGMCLSLWLVGLFVLPIVFFFIALVEIAVGIYLWLCVVSLYDVLGSPDWRNSDDWEMRPRFSTKYNGVPTSDD